MGSTNSPAYLKAFAEHAVTVTLAYRLRRVERSADGRLLATLYSEYARHEVTRAVGQVFVEHGTVPNDELYAELVPGASNKGAVDYRAPTRARSKRSLPGTPGGCGRMRDRLLRWRSDGGGGRERAPCG